MITPSYVRSLARNDDVTGRRRYLGRSMILGLGLSIMLSFGSTAWATPTTIDYTWNCWPCGTAFVGPTVVKTWTDPDPIPPLVLGNSYSEFTWFEPDMVSQALQMTTSITYDPEKEFISLELVHRDKSTFPFPQQLTQLFYAAQDPEFGLYWALGPADQYSNFIDVVSNVEWDWPVVRNIPEPGVVGSFALGLLFVAWMSARRMTG